MILFGAIAAGLAVLVAVLMVAAPVRVDARLAHPDAAALRLVAPRWSLAAWEGARCGLVMVGAGAHLPAPVVLIALLAPSLALRYRADAMHRAAASEAATVLQAVHAALRSGLGMAAALRSALEPASPLVREPFDRALRAFDANVAMSDALVAARATTGDKRLGLALDALALVAQEELPATRAAAVVGAVADRLAFERRMREEVDARASGVRWQITLLALLVPGTALYLALTMPGLAATLASSLGTHVLLPVAALLEITGIVASRSIVRGLAL